MKLSGSGEATWTLSTGALPSAARLSQSATSYTSRRPKTAKGNRQIALDPRTVEALKAHRKAQAQEQLAMGEHYQDNGLVFARPDGTPIHPDRVSKMFNRHVAASGLRRIRLHDLRHTHATIALRAGIHPKVVSERLGHGSVGITLDTYSHAIPAMQHKAAETVAALVYGDR